MQRSYDVLDQIAALVAERLGLSTHIQTHDTLEDILLPLVEGSSVEYLNQLRDSRTADAVWQGLIDALTIGETYFLRDRAHFHLLREHILPTLLDKRRHTRTLNIWSVGCATGEEPYSLAVTLAEILPDYDDWTINLIGTDINERSLRIARHGVYRKWAFRHTDYDFQGRYFDPTPDGLRIQPEIQQMVRFRQANIFSDAPLYEFDLILCRNVLLYFGQEAARRAEKVLHGALAPEGWLVLGHAEAIRHSMSEWMTHSFPGSPIYQKPAKTRNETGQSGAQSYERKTLTMEVVAVNPKESPPPTELYRQRYNEAVNALQSEDYDRAETHITALLDRSSEYAPARTVYACILANRHDMQQAHEQLDAALYIDPLLADAHYLRAVLFMEEDQPEEAQRSLVAALYCQRHHPLASFMLANLHAQAGEWVRANRYWQNTQQAIHSLAADSPISDISPLTAGQLTRMVNEHLQQ